MFKKIVASDGYESDAAASASSAPASLSTDPSHPSTRLNDADMERVRGLSTGSVTWRSFHYDNVNEPFSHRDKYGCAWSYLVLIPVKYTDKLQDDLVALFDKLKANGFSGDDDGNWSNVEIVVGVNGHRDLGGFHRELDWARSVSDQVKAIDYSKYPFNIKITSYLWGNSGRVDQKPCHSSLRKALTDSKAADHASRSLSVRYSYSGLSLSQYAVSMDADLIDPKQVFSFLDTTIGEAQSQTPPVTQLIISPGIQFPRPEKKTWDLSYLALKLDHETRQCLYEAHPRLSWFPEPCTALLYRGNPSKVGYEDKGGKDGRPATLLRLKKEDRSAEEFKKMSTYNDDPEHCILTAYSERTQRGYHEDHHRADDETFLDISKRDGEVKAYNLSFRTLRDIEDVSMHHQLDINFANRVLSGFHKDWEGYVTGVVGVRKNKLHSLVRRLFNVYHPTSYILRKVLEKPANSSEVLSFRDYMEKPEKRNELKMEHQEAFFKRFHEMEDFKRIETKGRHGIALAIMKEIREILTELRDRSVWGDKEFPQYVIDIYNELIPLSKKVAKLHFDFLKTHLSKSGDSKTLDLGPETHA